MARVLFLRLPATFVEPDAEPAAEWLLTDGERVLSGPQRSALSEAARAAAGARVIALAPGEQVLLSEATLPARSRQKAARAVAYALEEQLIDEVEDLHFALGPASGDNRYSVAVVAHASMAHWLDTLKTHGLHPDAVVPEVLALPWEAGRWTLAREDERVLVRTGAGSGFVVDAQAAAPLFARAWSEAGDAAPARVAVAAADPTALELPPGLEVVALPRTHERLLPLLAAGYSPSAGINLLQGAYSPREEIRKYLRPWYPAAALAGLWLVLLLGMTGHEYLTLAREAQAMEARIEAIYREAFPESQRVVNPRAQMQHGLEELRRARGQAGSSVYEMLAGIAPVLADTQDLVVQSLRYRQGQLDLDVELKDLQSLDKLKQQIADAGAWQVEIQSAAARDNRVQSRLQVRGGAS